MAALIRMPEVLANSSEAAIQTWLVSVGDTIAMGEPFAEVETEKAVVEYAAEVEGTVLRLLVKEGVSVSVGDPIAVVGAKGENVDDIDPTSTATAASAPNTRLGDEAADDVPAPLVDAGHRVFSSPLVRRLAKERRLDLTQVRGTGPGGRIVRRDIDKVLIAAPPSAPVEIPNPVLGGPDDGGFDVSHTAMRRAIARRLTESKSTIPHFYLVADCRVDALASLRTSINQASTVKISINDLVLKAAAGAFQDVPEANATWGESAVRRYTTVDMSVAVAIDGGLVTPVLRSVEKLSLSEIAQSVADLAERAKLGTLRQHELEGGSFAVSNLGMYGVTEFSAIINPPQSAILAVGCARKVPVVAGELIEVGTVMTVTMSADHRVIDGALAARWLAAFVRRIENPLSIVI
jgi:pyruvate dehydrogenase E2 component (dihydrolipoamide acetyltransferase)